MSSSVLRILAVGIVCSALVASFGCGGGDPDPPAPAKPVEPPPESSVAPDPPAPVEPAPPTPEPAKPAPVPYAAVEAGPLVGESDGPAFEAITPQPGVVVGIACKTVEEDSLVRLVRIEPVYDPPLDGDASASSDELPVRVTAKPGYAVGGLYIGSRGNGISGLRLVFMRRDGASLTPTDAYLSDWIGDRYADTVLGCDGRLVVGLHGKRDDRRCALGLLAVGSPTTDAKTVAEAIGLRAPGKFEPLEVGAPVTTMALSEDGKTLVFAHADANRLTVWDVASGAAARTIETPRPWTLMCRGGTVIVGHRGEGRITAFDTANDWSATVHTVPANLVERLDPTRVAWLDAPGGEKFDGLIAATYLREPRRENEPPADYQMAYVIVADVREKNTPIVAGPDAFNGPIVVSYDASVVLRQDRFATYPQHCGHFSVYDWRQPYAHPVNQKTRGPEFPVPRVYQVRPSDYWIAGDAVLVGDDIANDRRWNRQVDVGIVALADATAPLIYGLADDGRQLTVHRADATTVERIDEAPLTPTEMPTLHLPTTDPDLFFAATQSPFSGDAPLDRVSRFYHPIAVTLDGQLHLFLLDAETGRVHHAQMRGFNP